ncbi:unnamed protein product [Effrenium voratum]|uniref:SAP domain-containing protein n=1 Tax=Effrenium voratum TaxID=2562239 RepID=A0AA36HW50_9DINO|nr:unnamed protein product [Effrenium voratum]
MCSALSPMELPQEPDADAAPALSLSDLDEVLVEDEPSEEIFGQLAAWAAAEHGGEGGLSSAALGKLLGLLLEACRGGRWDCGTVAAQVLMQSAALEPGVLTTLLEEQLLSAARRGFLLSLAAFGEMLEEPVLAPSQGESFSEPEPWKQSLAALVAALGAVFRSAACPKLAEAMLPTLAGGLLCAAGTSPAPELVGGGFLGGSLAFHLLQARRSLAELLNTLLEEAPAELRLRQEQQLLLEGPGPSRLVESLCLARPDPKLHEMLLELLWRGLRRRDGATQGTAALDLLGALKGPKIQHQLRHEVSAEQLMDWGLDLSLDLSRRRKEIQGLACSVAWGGLRAYECMATFSAHSLVVEGFLSNEDDEQVELSFEVPWVFVQNPDAATARGFPLHLPVALEPLRKSGALEAALAELVSLPEAVLHIDSTVEEPKTRQIFEELNKLFQGLGCSQDETMRSNTFEESNTCFVTPTKTRPVPEEDVVWTPPPSQNLLNEASAASPKRSPPRESQRVRALAESQDFKESQPSGGSAAATVEMKGPAGPSPSPSQEVEEARAEMKELEMASVSDEAERTPEVGVEPDKGESLPASKEVDVAAAETRAADISPMRGQVEEARAEMKELEIASVSDEAQRTPEVGVERASPDKRESLPASKEVRPEAELISAEPQEAGIRAGVKDPEMSATTDQASEPEVEEFVRQDVLPEAEGGQASPPPPLSPEKVKEVQPPEQDLQDPIPEIEEEEPKPEKDADQDLRTLSYKELSALAKRRGVRAGGKKAELLRRMQKWERERSKTQPKEPKAKPKPKPKAKEERARHAMPESPPDFAESPRGDASETSLPAESSSQGIEQLPLAELRKACEDLGMATDGGKEALLKRLAMYADSAMTPPMTQSQNFGTQVDSQPGGNLALPPESQPAGDLSLPPDSQPAGVRRSLPRETEGPELMPPPEVPRKRARTAAPATRAETPTRTTHHLIHDLSALTVKELRQACKDRSLPAHGAKPDLVERLAEAERLAQAEQAPSPSPGLWVPPTRSPLCATTEDLHAAQASPRSEDGIEPATEAEQAAAACGVLASVAKSLGALPIEELRSACSARGLTARGSRQQLVGRLAALLAPRPDVEASQSEEVPASLSLSLSGLQAACRACGLPAAGEPAELAERLAIHVASQEENQPVADSGAVGFAQAADPADPIVSFSNPAASEASNAEGTPMAVKFETENLSCAQAHEAPIAAFEANPSPWSVPAAQPDVTQAKNCTNSMAPSGGLVAHGFPAPDASGRAPERLDEGFRAGLRLLHTEELRRACLERGLDIDGHKGDLLNRLLAHFAHAPLPTPTQDLSPPKPAAQPAATAGAKPPASAPPAAPESRKPKPQAAPQIAQLSPVASGLAKEVAELRPLQHAVKELKAPQNSLLRRPRVAAASAAPNFSALWQTMCKSTARESAREAAREGAPEGGGVGLSVRPPGAGPRRGKPKAATGLLGAKARRKARVGSCHGRTAAGAACRNAGRQRPAGARFVYCAQHAARWPRFETVGVDQLNERPPIAAIAAAAAASSGKPAPSRPIATPARARAAVTTIAPSAPSEMLSQAPPSEALTRRRTRPVPEPVTPVPLGPAPPPKGQVARKAKGARASRASQGSTRKTPETQPATQTQPEIEEREPPARRESAEAKAAPGPRGAARTGAGGGPAAAGQEAPLMHIFSPT